MILLPGNRFGKRGKISLVSHYSTIDDWFDWLEKVADKEPVKLEMKFNSRYGFPEMVEYDHSYQLADAELLLKIGDLRSL